MRKILLFVILLIGGYLYLTENQIPITEESASTHIDSQVESSKGDQQILNAFANQQSDLQVQAQGIVSRMLADDNEGSRHQRFIVELAGGHTVLISHNIDLAPRINALRTGDVVQFYGEYEWNPQGGVVHWTHHDPKGRHADGWIRHNGEIYQ